VYNKNVIIDLINLKERKIPMPDIAKYLNQEYDEKLGLKVNDTQLHARYWYYKKRNRINEFFDEDYRMPESFEKKEVKIPVPKKRGKKKRIMTYTLEQEQFLAEMYNEGKKGKEMTEKFNKEFNTKLIRRQVVDKVKHLVKTKRINSLSKGFGRPSLFPPEIELVLIQLANDGHKSTDIRDAVNSQFGKHYSKKQVIDKLYNLKQKGRVTK
jgi:hypothetical protein